MLIIFWGSALLYRVIEAGSLLMLQVRMQLPDTADAMPSPQVLPMIRRQDVVCALPLIKDCTVIFSTSFVYVQYFLDATENMRVESCVVQKLEKL